MATLNDGKEFWLCTKQQPDEDQKKLKKILECREGLPHYIVLAKARVSTNGPKEEFYIHIVFRSGLDQYQNMQNTPKWPPAQEKQKPKKGKKDKNDVNYPTNPTW